MQSYNAPDSGAATFQKIEVSILPPSLLSTCPCPPFRFLGSTPQSQLRGLGELITRPSNGFNAF